MNFHLLLGLLERLTDLLAQHSPLILLHLNLSADQRVAMRVFSLCLLRAYNAVDALRARIRALLVVAIKYHLVSPAAAKGVLRALVSEHFGGRNMFYI